MFFKSERVHCSVIGTPAKIIGYDKFTSTDILGEYCAVAQKYGLASKTAEGKEILQLDGVVNMVKTFESGDYGDKISKDKNSLEVPKPKASAPKESFFSKILPWK